MRRRLIIRNDKGKSGEIRNISGSPSVGIFRNSGNNVVVNRSFAASPNKVGKRGTIVFNDWQYFNARRELKGNIGVNIKELRRKISNPYMYGDDVNEEQYIKAMEERLYKAFRRIHCD